jgi:hypothetical protein
MTLSEALVFLKGRNVKVERVADTEKRDKKLMYKVQKGFGELMYCSHAALISLCEAKARTEAARVGEFPPSKL